MKNYVVSCLLLSPAVVPLTYAFVIQFGIVQHDYYNHFS